MANDFYNVITDLEPFTRVRSGVRDAEFAGVAAGFDKLPSETRLLSGNSNFVTAGGTANAITVSAPTTWTSYTGKDGYKLSIKITTTNTGAVTLNVDGLGVKSCVRLDGDALAADDLQANGIYDFFYNNSTGKFHVAAWNGIVTDAEAQASAAATSASNAATSATNAASSASSAAASFDSFDDRYLGAKSSDPATDNDGDALLVGALYFNSTSNVMRQWNGSAWADSFATVDLEGSASGAIDMAGFALNIRWTTKTGAYTAVKGDRLLADTSAGAVTITLPASPTSGDEVWFADPGANWATNNLTVDGNGNNVDGASTFAADVNEGHFAAVYDGTDWVVRFAGGVS